MANINTIREIRNYIKNLDRLSIMELNMLKFIITILCNDRDIIPEYLIEFQRAKGFINTLIEQKNSDMEIDKEELAELQEALDEAETLVESKTAY